MPTLYDSKFSGNGWKVRLLLSFLGQPFERRILNLAAGEARTPEMLARNPLGRVPVLVLDDGTALFESNAILLHLARGTRWLPDDPLAQARVLQWLFFEQFDHLRYFARPRFLVSIAKSSGVFPEEVAYLRQVGQKALDALEARLAGSRCVAGDDWSVADIALFPYTGMAEMGGYDLSPHPAVRRWLDAFRALPGFIPLIPNPEVSP